MANPNFVVKVSVEKTVHDGVHKAFQEIYDKYGVIINSIKADWTSVQIYEQKQMLLSGVTIETSTKA